jgi:hypothetical protein
VAQVVEHLLGKWGPEFKSSVYFNTVFHSAKQKLAERIYPFLLYKYTIIMEDSEIVKTN